VVGLNRAALGALPIAIALFALCASAGCGGAQRAEPRAEVRFVIVPETARVYTDERFVGSARVLAQRPAQFRRGPRRFTITADGHFPHDLEVDLPQGTTTIDIRLRPVPR
jgi:hypothetical protein